MLENSSSHTPETGEPPEFMPPKPVRGTSRRWGLVLAFPLWVLASFVIAQAIVVAVVSLLSWFGVPFELVGAAVLQTAAAAIVYMLSFGIAVGLTEINKKKRASLKELGLGRLPSWADIGLAPVGFIVYFIASATLIFFLSQIIPGFDIGQAQEVGFDNLVQRHEYLLAFVTLVVVAPFAEEALFRGYLYGNLRRHIPLWLAMLVTSILFGAIHGQLNVAIDTFALSMVMCGLREVTGSIWAGVLLHMMKNGLAFYLLFVNPSLVGIMV